MMTWEEAIKHIEDIRASALENLGAKYAFGCEGYYRSRIELAEICLAALRPVSREQIEKVWRGEWTLPIFADQDDYDDPRLQCSKCGSIETPLAIHQFCPMCGAPMTDEAVQMVMERLEALKDADD